MILKPTQYFAVIALFGCIACGDATEATQRSTELASATAKAKTVKGKKTATAPKKPLVSPCDGVDTMDLNAVANCFYQPKQERSALGKWAFVSSVTKKEMSETQFDKWFKELEQTTLVGVMNDDLTVKNEYAKLRIESSRFTIGIGVETIHTAQGLRVISLSDVSRAQTNNLQKGDLIIGVNNTMLAGKSAKEMNRLTTAKQTAGIEIKLSILRDGQELKMKVKTAKTKTCERESTQTWVQEKGGWKILLTPRQKELANRKFDSGEYQKAIEAAKAWLKKDPFNIDAVEKLLLSLVRHSQRQLRKERGDLLRLLMNINPTDHSALFSATTHTPDKTVSEAFLERLPKNACVYKNAVFNFALEFNHRKQLKLLDKFTKIDDPTFYPIRIDAYLRLNQRDALKTLLTQKDFDDVYKQQMAGNDPSYITSWVVPVIEGYLKLKLVDKADTWIQYLVTKNPTDRRVARLLKRVNRAKAKGNQQR